MFSVPRFSSWWSEGADSKRGNSRETHTHSLSLTLNSLLHTHFPSLSLCPTPSLTRRDVMTLAGKAAENGFAQDSLPPPQMFSYKQQTNTLTHSWKRKKRIHLLVSLWSTRTHAHTHSRTHARTRTHTHARTHALTHSARKQHALLQTNSPTSPPVCVLTCPLKLPTYTSPFSASRTRLWRQ